jgi:hypothetical protein
MMAITPSEVARPQALAGRLKIGSFIKQTCFSRPGPGRCFSSQLPGHQEDRRQKCPGRPLSVLCQSFLQAVFKTRKTNGKNRTWQRNVGRGMGKRTQCGNAWNLTRLQCNCAFSRLFLCLQSYGLLCKNADLNRRQQRWQTFFFRSLFSLRPPV